MSIMSFQDLPVVNQSWDGDEARSAIARWAGGPDKKDIDWSKYKKAFLYVKSDGGEDKGDYKMPFATVIDGTLKAVDSGIEAAAGALRGARGGVDIPDDEVSTAKNHLEKYYDKLDRPAPWEEEEGKQLFHAKIKASDNDRIIEGYASVEREDRDGEVIPVDAFGFQDYNGSLLYNHGFDPEVDRNPVGKVLNWRREPGGLWIRARISDATEYGDKVWNMIQDGLLNSFSVSAPDSQVEKDGNVITEWPIAEISVVTLPSNPSSTFATAKNYKHVSQMEQTPSLRVKEIDQKMSLLCDKLNEMLNMVEEISS